MAVILPMEKRLCGTDPFDPTDDLADSDNDGMTDYWEEQEGADMFNPDTDGDGVLDGEEYDNGMDPTDDDTDNDGMKDGDELGGDGIYDEGIDSDPLKKDTDGDGVRDGKRVQQRLGSNQSRYRWRWSHRW